MPTILRSEGLSVVIYPKDHPPAHVHVIGPDWEVVINLIGLEVREVIDCSDRDARRALRLVSDNRVTLLNAWRRIHE